MIFALIFVFSVGVVGLAIDGARYYSAARHVEASLDATALMAAKLASADEYTNQEIRTRALNYFQEQTSETFGVRDIDVTTFELTPNQQDGSIEIEFAATVPTTVLRAVAIDQLNLERVAAVSYNARRIEVSLVLDTTGSMCNPSCSKLDALKDAAKSLIDVLYNDDTPKGFVRVALVPYATTVNVGTDYFVAASVGELDATHAPCVMERVTSEQYTDHPALNPHDVGTGDTTTNTRFACPSRPLVPLTDLRQESARNAFKDDIDDLTANGWTAGHLGVAWGWYTVSPRWKPLWPSESDPRDYGHRDNLKSVVIMSDGMFNTAYSGTNDNSTNKLDVGSSAYQALQLCSAMRQAGIMIYTIAFQAPATAEALLLECAGSTENYYDAETSSELINAFRDVAAKLKSMRLTR
ncbi:MAG: Tad domain-containing protein [Pseudomonadota bacterium]